MIGNESKINRKKFMKICFGTKNNATKPMLLNVTKIVTHVTSEKKQKKSPFGFISRLT